MHEVAKTVPTPAPARVNDATNTAVPAATQKATTETNQVVNQTQYRPIEGAFGKKLGDSFDPATAIGTIQQRDGTPVYEFTPALPFRSFNHYYVNITPHTRAIYAIWASESLDNQDEAKEELAIVMEMLKEKYGPEKERGIADTADDPEEIEQGNRAVGASIDEADGTTLILGYDDNDLAKRAEQERIAGEVQSTDKSGL
jgi:hypothetical protein